MSNVDEILKLKELLDKEIITKEEFEKKKSELLNMDTQTTKNVNESQNANVKQGKNTAPKGCLITFNIFIIIIVLSIIMSIVRIMQEPDGKSQTQSLLVDQYNLSEEEVKNVINTINQCGYSDYFSNYFLSKGSDNNEIPGSQGFEINKNDKIIGFVDIKDNKVCLIQYSDKILYKDDAIQHTLSEYIITEDEKVSLINKTQEIIKAILKSPSTAKFPWNNDEWATGKQDGKTIVQGYVDSQNSFGATIRSEFQVTYTNDTVTSLILDGEEYIK